MAEDFVAEDKRLLVGKLGADFGLQLHLVRIELLYAYMKWDEYKILFGEDESVVELLNDVAPHLFGIVQSIMLDDIILHVMRLFDGKKNSGRIAGSQTVSIYGLMPHCGSLGDHPLKERIDRIAREFSNFVELRNSRLAHRRFDLCVIGLPFMPPVSRADVARFLLEIGELVNEISEHAGVGRIEFHEFISSLSGARALIPAIRAGLNSRASGLARGDAPTEPGV